MSGHIFISYSSHDTALANQLVAYLEQQGYPCWIAPRDIASGGDYTDFINDSIHDCRALVLIMTERSVRSQWVKKELSTAVSYNRTILPLRIDPVQLESGLQFLLNNVQWIDATKGSPASHFGQVISGIKNELPMSAPPEPPARRGFPWWLFVPALVVVLVGAGILIWQPSGSEEDGIADSVDGPKVEALPVKVDTVVIERTVTVAPTVTQRTGKKEEKTVEVEETAPEPEVATPEPEPVVVAPEPEAVPEPKSEPVVTQPVKRTPTAAELAAERYNRQFKKAKRFYDAGNYRDALSVFEALKREKPSDSQLDPYIRECRKHI